MPKGIYLHIGKPRTWTQEKTSFLINNHKKMTHKELGKALNKSYHGVQWKCNTLSLHKQACPITLKNFEQKLKTKKLTNFERGFLAGIIDGEGCLAITKNHNGFFTFISISNTDKEMLINITKILDKLEINYNLKNHTCQKPNNKKAYYIRINKYSDIAILLTELKDSFLSKKNKLRSTLLLKYCISRINKIKKNGKNIPIEKEEIEIWKKIKKLNHRGR